MSGYAPARALLTENVWSPLHRREWAVTPAQRRVLEIVGPGGWRGTLRELAAAAGYGSAGAAHNALRSLITGGLLAVQAARGRHGGTRIRLRPGVTLTARVAAVVEGMRSALSRMAEHWKPPTRVLEDPRPRLTADALATRRRMIESLRRTSAPAVEELKVRHAHGSDEELAACDRCAGVVREAWERAG